MELKKIIMQAYISAQALYSKTGKMDKDELQVAVGAFEKELNRLNKQNNK